jgi:hypothetical protein
MQVPVTVSVQLVCQTRTGLAGVIVSLSIRAGRKNAYSVLFPKTSESGMALLTNQDIVEQFAHHHELALMDYDGSLDTASSIVIASLFDPRGLMNNREVALASPLVGSELGRWASSQERFDYFVSCQNRQFTATPQEVDLEANPSFEFAIVLR